MHTVRCAVGRVSSRGGSGLQGRRECRTGAVSSVHRRALPQQCSGRCVERMQAGEPSVRLSCMATVPAHTMVLGVLLIARPRELRTYDVVQCSADARA